MITLSEHTIEESIIDENGWVLDLGCVNFSFTNDIKKYCNLLTQLHIVKCFNVL